MALPESLIQLEPFISRLQSLPAEEVNEDIDADLLIRLLRERVAGMSEAEAVEEIEEIGRAIEAWILDSPDENLPAVWLQAFLSDPDLANELLSPADPADEGPEIQFDLPSGWTEKRVPDGVEFKRGDLTVVMNAVDQLTLEMIAFQNSHWVAHPPLVATLTKSSISLGPVHGHKYLLAQTAPMHWKSIDYVLEVPGGFATLRIVAKNGAEFDESLIEDRLHTLSVIGGPVETNQSED